MTFDNSLVKSEFSLTEPISSIFLLRRTHSSFIFYHGSFSSEEMSRKNQSSLFQEASLQKIPPRFFAHGAGAPSTSDWMVGEMKSQAIIVAAPFSFTLGYLASLVFAIVVQLILKEKIALILKVFAYIPVVQGVCPGKFIIPVCNCGHIPPHLLCYMVSYVSKNSF